MVEAIDDEQQQTEQDATAPDKMTWPRVLSSRMKPVRPTSRTPPKTRPHHSNHGIRGSASSTLVLRWEASTVSWPRNSLLIADAAASGS